MRKGSEVAEYIGQDWRETNGKFLKWRRSYRIDWKAKKSRDGR